MKMRPVLTIGLAVGLALLLSAEPGLALTAAARPRTPIAAASITASDPARAAVPLQHMDGDRNLHLAPSAPCEVSGLITTDTTWGPSLCDPYVVTGNVSVQSGATLTIQAGTTVKFNSLTALAVAGTLLACGTEANRITFTSNRPSPEEGDWGYIHLTASSTDATPDRDCSGHGSGSIIQYAVIEYAGGASVYYIGALHIQGSSPIIGHNIVRNNNGDGIILWASGAAPRITGNTVSGNSDDGIVAGYLINSGTIISGNSVTDNSGCGIYVDERATVSNNVVTGNSGGGIYVDSSATIRGNRISNNAAPVGGGIYAGGYDSTPTISGNVIISNTASLANRGGGIYIADNTNPAINDNDLYGNMSGTPANVPNDLYNGNAFGEIPVNAEYNYWGTTDPAVMEGHIWHFMDDPSLGVVSYGHNPSPSVPCTVLGLITTDTMWGPGLCAPYVVAGNVSVQSGATLTIQPGTTVKFDSLKALAVAGTLVACGTEANRITFTSNRPSPEEGDWGYIHLAASSTDATPDRDCSGRGSGSIIQYAVIEYAGGASVYYIGALHIQGSSPIIDHNIVRNNNGDGIILWDSAAPRITGNAVSGNSSDGIVAGYLINSKTTISGNAVTGNSGCGIYVDERATVSDNTVTGNSGGGIYVDSSATIRGNRISNNVAPVGGGIYAGGYSSAPTISGNVIISNTASLANRGGGIYIADNTNPTINDNDLYGNVTGNPATVPNDLYNGNKYGQPDVNAENNYWGTTNCDDVEGYVWHFMDDARLGSVDYKPCRCSSIITPTSILTPTLYAISNPDRNGDYTVDWSDVIGVITYTLQEDNNAGFTGPTTRYTDSASQYAVNGQAVGTWYYRVKAANAGGESGWSNVQSTTVVPPTQGDAYEPDDICGQASVLATDGTPQSHTFHDSGDADWAHFTVTSGITYVVQATSTSPGADLMLELYDACDGNLEGSDDDAFGNDARLLFVAPSGGTYYVKALNHNPAVYGPDVTYELSVRAQTPGGVVLIVAGHDDNYRLQNHILYAANFAYRTFLKGGILKAHIRYLSAIDADPDGDGVSDVYASSASANVQTAITTWAANLTDSHTPFYLYLVDHGGVDTFLTDGIGDAITPTTLSGWLDALETPVNVIYEACHSGSFIDGLEEISKPGRVVIASTGRLNSAYPTPGRGAYFSDAFFTALGQSQDLWTSFQEGVRAVGATGLWQTPWLDDDGDAGPNTLSDGAVARGRGLANFDFPVGRPPVVDEVLPPESIQGDRCILKARARDDGKVVQVWAVVYPPSFDEPVPAPDGTMPDLGLPKVGMSDSNNDGVYEGVYEGCTEGGTYRLVVYAEDGEGNLSQPAVLEVRTWQVYLPLVLR